MAARGHNAAAERIELRLLGDLAILRDGKPCPLPASKKTRALLGYLVATGRSSSRERLCELLWEIPDDPRGALRWSLSKLRPLVDCEVRPRLVADRERVGFEPHGATVDLLDVRALAAKGLAEAGAADLAAALERFRGPFLEGLDLPDCVRFYAWCIAEREAARAIHVGLLRALIVRVRERPGEALAHARALVALDPLAESSHAEVVRLLAATGRCADALEAYERCRKILDEQLGTRPSSELERLRASIRPGSTAAAAGGVAATAARPRTSTPPAPASARERPKLVGRARELAALLEVLPDATAANRSPAALLVGAPGIGKSRLLEELAQVAVRRGLRLLEARAFEGERGRPYGVWVEALRAIPPEGVPDHLRTDLAVILPELGASLPHGDQPRLFEAIAALVRTPAPSTSGTLVILDDLQWMDEGSAALLHFITRGREHHLALACAARIGELDDNAAAARALRALEHQGALRRLELEPLAPEETAALARSVAADVDGPRVHEASRGNPLFALELARSLARGADGGAGSLTRRVRERLDDLGEAEQAVMPWAAALGRRFDVDVLAKVSGLTGTALLEGLRGLERHGVVQADGPASYDFSHDVTREAAYARLSEPRRRLVHLQIARALWSDDGEGAAEVVRHAALASEHELAARACVAAGERCVRVFAYGDARELARRGLEHARHLADHARIPLTVDLLGLRVSEPGGDDVEELAFALERLGREADAATLAGPAMRANYLRSVLLFGAGDYSRAFAASVRRVEARRVAPSSAAAQNLLGHARCLALVERDMAAVARVLDGAAASPTTEWGSLDFHWARGLLRRFQGDLDGAMEDLVFAARRTAGIERHWERSWCLSALIRCALDAHRADDVMRFADELEDLAVQMGAEVERSVARAARALALLSRGDRAWNALEDALAGVRAADGKASLATLSNFAAEEAVRSGDRDLAWPFAEQALTAAAAMAQASEAMLARAQLARLALARGDARDARSLAGELDAGLAAGPWAASARARAAARAVLIDLEGGRPDTHAPVVSRGP